MKFLESLQSDFRVVDKVIGSIDIEKSAARNSIDRELLLRMVRKASGGTSDGPGGRWDYARCNSVIIDELTDWVMRSAGRALEALAGLEDDMPRVRLKMVLGELLRGQVRACARYFV